jgi:hypothetical protein
LDFGIASGDQTEPATPKPILPPDPLRNSRNFRLSNDVASHIAEGGSKTRIQNNLDILELLKSIQAEQRTATKDEQNRIAKYIDFGGLRELWDQGYRYYEERNRLTEILTEEEIDAVKETSLNTHYTAIEVVDQMWAAADRLGFNGGRILEPGIGVGNFFARIPDQVLHETELFGVEKNPLSGALASMLYPDAKILVQPFEDTRLPNNSFDMVIGNPPFADIKIADPEYSDPKLSLHNYFLVKSLDKLKPGGIAVCISSHYTLDSLDVRARRAMAARADLVAAIRLPDDTFKKNANTAVTTDILFFRKRLPNELQSEHPVWIDSIPHVVPGYGDHRSTTTSTSTSILRWFSVFTVRKAECMGGKTTRSNPLKATRASFNVFRKPSRHCRKISSPLTIRLSPRIHGTTETLHRSFPRQTQSRIIHTSSTKAPSGSTTTAPGHRCHAHYRVGAFSFN